MTITIDDDKAIKKVKMNKASDLSVRTLIENTENNIMTTGRLLFDRNLSGTSDPVVHSGNYGGKEKSFTLSQLKGVVSLLQIGRAHV
jgi:hypothetical protein